MTRRFLTMPALIAVSAGASHSVAAVRGTSSYVVRG